MKLILYAFALTQPPRPHTHGPGVARAELARGFATIQRTDRNRVVTVTADVNRAITTPQVVLAQVNGFGYTTPSNNI